MTVVERDGIKPDLREEGKWLPKASEDGSPILAYPCFYQFLVILFLENDENHIDQYH